MSIQQIWDAVLLNVFANWLCFAIPVFLSVLLWIALDLRTLSEAKRFFGIASSGRIHVYISAHEDMRTRTRKVLTAEEAEAAFEFGNLLVSQMHRSSYVRDLILIGSQIIHWDLKLPELVLRASPLQEVKEWPDQNSLVLIGGPVRNQLTKYYSAKRDPWFVFDAQHERFIINKGDRAGQEIEQSGKCAVINRIIVDGATVFIVAGFGEVETRAALKYLAVNWRTLYQKYPDQEFGICVLIGDQSKPELLFQLPTV